MICTYCEAQDDPAKYHKSYLINIMKHKKICFTCAIWVYNSTYLKKDIIVIDGSAYIDSGRKYNVPKHTLGFDGREYYIKRERKIIQTNNLNFKGKVPEYFLDSFPDNSSFITRKEAETLHLLKVADFV